MIVRRNRNSLFPLFILIFGLGLAGGSACSETAIETEPGTAVGNYAPVFEAPITSGDTIKLDDLRGSGVVVNFWSTWCPPCVKELPLLDSTAKNHLADSLVVIAVNMGDSEEEINDFLADMSLEFPVAIDSLGKVSREYQVAALPVTFFIDRDGVIQYKRTGELTEADVANGLDSIL